VTQEEQRNDGLLSLVAGIGVGVLVGAAVALLVAPQSGEETRSTIRESAEDALGGIRTSIEELRVKLDDVRSAVRKRGQEGGESESGLQASGGEQSA